MLKLIIEMIRFSIEKILNSCIISNDFCPNTDTLQMCMWQSINHIDSRPRKILQRFKLTTLCEDLSIPEWQNLDRTNRQKNVRLEEEEQCSMDLRPYQKLKNPNHSLEARHRYKIEYPNYHDDLTKKNTKTKTTNNM